MTITIVLHITNEDPILAEVDQLPEPQDQMLAISNPRLRDGKDLHYLEDETTSMIIPWHRINFVEILPSAELEEIVTIVREE
jgi:hypothetical protein